MFSTDDHVERLHVVLGRLLRAGLKLKSKKCHFVCQLSRYLGHVITPESYCLTLTKLKQSRTLQFPLAFLECVSSWDLRPIIATTLETLLALPLHSLTRKSAEFQWTDECQVAFDLLKDKLTTTPILAFPNFDLPFMLETGTYIQGLGAVLS